MNNRTEIYRQTSTGERPIGALTSAGWLVKASGQTEINVGRVEENRIYRLTAHNQRELGTYNDQGMIHSHGLFDGGQIGWVDPDGVVIQSGLIMGEEEVGRVAGPQTNAAAAALLLLFLPDQAEAEKLMQRR